MEEMARKTGTELKKLKEENQKFERERIELLDKLAEAKREVEVLRQEVVNKKEDTPKKQKLLELQSTVRGMQESQKQMDELKAKHALDVERFNAQLKRAEREKQNAVDAIQMELDDTKERLRLAVDRLQHAPKVVQIEESDEESYPFLPPAESNQKKSHEWIYFVAGCTLGLVIVGVSTALYLFLC